MFSARSVELLRGDPIIVIAMPLGAAFVVTMSGMLAFAGLWFLTLIS
ncbi:hypothetical protein FM113_08815 [Leucobacter sp. 7(1)]|nr:hypothetical protein [Leucobacter sp. 7(1)]SJN10325.1 hypothetical protein FM113_08815 [Leucobacter sp. 7(1)]